MGSLHGHFTHVHQYSSCKSFNTSKHPCKGKHHTLTHSTGQNPTFMPEQNWGRSRWVITVSHQWDSITKRSAILSTGWSFPHHEWKSLQGDTFTHRCWWTVWKPPAEICALCYSTGQIWSGVPLAFKPKKLQIAFKEYFWQILPHNSQQNKITANLGERWENKSC